MVFIRFSFWTCSAVPFVLAHKPSLWKLFCIFLWSTEIQNSGGYIRNRIWSDIEEIEVIGNIADVFKWGEDRYIIDIGQKGARRNIWEWDCRDIRYTRGKPIKRKRSQKL